MRRIFHLIETQTFFTREEAQAAYVGRLFVYRHVPPLRTGQIELKLMEYLEHETVQS